MLETVVEILLFTFYTIFNLYLIRSLLESNERVWAFKNILLMIILTAVSFISYTEAYLIQPILMRTMVGIIIYKIIFDESITKVGSAYLIILFVTLFTDLINTLIFVTLVPASEIRSKFYYLLLSNISNIIMILVIFQIKPFVERVKKFLKNIKKENNTTLIIFYSLVFLVVICIFFNIVSIYELNKEFIINILTALVFLIITVIYLADKNKYYKLYSEYDILFKYVQQFEDTIDNMDLNNHEYKNQLAVLRGYIEESNKKESLKIIDEMAKESYKSDKKVLSELKNIPKGGIKGLLYYKILVANNKKLNLSIDISNTIIGELEKLDSSQVKTLCRLIGIYLDNAIDAAKESKRKLISIEIYKLDDEVQFVFSNSLKLSKIDINKIREKGYTTKGEGHGKGLYLAEKILLQSRNLKAESKIFNHLYIQKLIIKTPN